MKVVFAFSIATLFLISCSAEQKEKELPSYFCNGNFERYFAGNDSLPIININPNDSLNLSLQKLDSLYQDFEDYLDIRFRTPIILDTLHQPFLLVIGKTDIEVIPKKINNLRKREHLLIEYIFNDFFINSDLGDLLKVREVIFNHILNNGENPFLSTTPNEARVEFLLSRNIDQKSFNQTIKTVISGYTDVLNHQSQLKYKKSFCELDSIESRAIRISIPFNFFINYQDFIAPAIQSSSFVAL